MQAETILYNQVTMLASIIAAYFDNLLNDPIMLTNQ